jgi:hypothetical protein
MTKSVAKPKTGQGSLVPVSVFSPQVDSDHTFLKHEIKEIARQASVCRGWIAAFRGVSPG